MLSEHGRVVNRPKKIFETLAVRTASHDLKRYSSHSSFKKKGDQDVRTIARFFKKNTRHEDKRYNKITYRELSPILTKYGFELDGPSNNKINIIKVTKEKKGIFKKREETIRKTIFQVGCPRMTAQINPKALKEVLKACGLTAKNGYDSAVVFGNCDPITMLIGEFQDPLRRLKDK